MNFAEDVRRFQNADRKSRRTRFSSFGSYYITTCADRRYSVQGHGRRGLSPSAHGETRLAGFDSSSSLSASPVYRVSPRGAPLPHRRERYSRFFGWVPFLVSQHIRQLGFADMRCLSHRLRRATARHSICADMPRRGPRGPNCGTAQHGLPSFVPGPTPSAQVVM